MKAGLHWEDVDQFGNNSVNLSAAGNHIDIFKSLLQYGVLVNVKNARGHSVIELSTNKNILDLAKAWERAEICHLSKEPFKEYEIKQWCWICDNFFKRENFRMEWVMKDARQEEENLVDGRCIDCWRSVEQHTKDIERAIENRQEEELTTILDMKKA